MIIAVAATLTILEASFRIAKDWDFSWPYTDPAKILRGKDNAVETVTTWYGRKKAFLPQDEPDEIGKHLKKWFPLLPPHVTRVVEAVQ
ncbi:MAG: hypothetical protein EXS50_00460 [Candidatus Taylorbacteria bacterium]|nr:hypothetical protein [Candidatus Taylorbacteria bacterium]